MDNNRFFFKEEKYKTNSNSIYSSKSNLKIYQFHKICKCILIKCNKLRLNETKCANIRKFDEHMNYRTIPFWLNKNTSSKHMRLENDDLR